MDGKDESLTNLTHSVDQDNPEKEAEGFDHPQDENGRIYLVDKSADTSELVELHQKSGGKAEFTKWRTWNLAQEMESKQKDKLIEKMAARLQEIEEKLERIQNSIAE